jgi:hypothetical protein
MQQIARTAPGRSRWAAVSLYTPEMSFVGVSARALRAVATNDPARLVVTFMGDLRTTLSTYSRRAYVVTGFEPVPAARDRPIEGRPPLDLTGLKPADALARIVALDSRYELSRSTW